MNFNKRIVKKIEFVNFGFLENTKTQTRRSLRCNVSKEFIQILGDFQTRPCTFYFFLCVVQTLF